MSGDGRSRPWRALAIGPLVALALLRPLPALAVVSPAERLTDPALEARARALSRELRCLVCQNQSIDDSDAELARDLRTVVRERLVAGASDAAIKDYLVARYGDFVLLTPPVRPGTWILWAGPFVVLLAGATGIAWAARRRRRDSVAGAVGSAEPAALTTSEEAEVAALLVEDGRRR